MDLPRLHTRSALLTAADCNAQLEMPMPLLEQIAVEVATDHAALLGVGYSRLNADGLAWVMLRFAAEVDRMPRVNEVYRIDTWVESFNRRFSRRDFLLSVGQGDECLPIGRLSTVWGVIESATRRAATLDGLEALTDVASPRNLPFARQPRLRDADFDAATTRDYNVVVSDIDSNRHLTAARYMELMLDMWPLEWFDAMTPSSLEIAYNNEARFGDRLTIDRLDLQAGSAACRIRRDSETLASATVSFAPRG